MWRNQAWLGLLGGMAPALPAFVEVRVAEVEPAAPAPLSASETGPIRIALPIGVHIAVDAAAQARVLSVLKSDSFVAADVPGCGVPDMRNRFDGPAVLVP